MQSRIVAIWISIYLHCIHLWKQDTRFLPIFYSLGDEFCCYGSLNVQKSRLSSSVGDIQAHQLVHQCYKRTVIFCNRTMDGDWWGAFYCIVWIFQINAWLSKHFSEHEPTMRVAPTVLPCAWADAGWPYRIEQWKMNACVENVLPECGMFFK